MTCQECGKADATHKATLYILQSDGTKRLHRWYYLCNVCTEEWARWHRLRY